MRHGIVVLSLANVHSLFVMLWFNSYLVPSFMSYNALTKTFSLWDKSLWDKLMEKYFETNAAEKVCTNALHWDLIAKLWYLGKAQHSLRSLLKISCELHINKQENNSVNVSKFIYKYTFNCRITFSAPHAQLAAVFLQSESIIRVKVRRVI